MKTYTVGYGIDFIEFCQDKLRDEPSFYVIWNWYKVEVNKSTNLTHLMRNIKTLGTPVE